MNGIDFGRAFKAPFDDPDWVKKTLFGMLWGALIVTAPAVTGAMLDYIKSTAQGNERLPEWDDFGDKWVRGFMVGVAGFIYFLPVWVIAAFTFVPLILAGNTNSNALSALASGGACLFGLVAIVYAVAVAVIFYAAIVNYALTGDFAAFFRFGDLIARVRSSAGYWAAFGTGIVASFAASAVAGVVGAIPVVGWLVTCALSYLAYMVAAHAFGQWAATSYGMPGLAAAPAGYPPAAAAPGAYAPPVAPTYAPPTPPAPPAYAPPAPVAPVAPSAPAAPAPETPAAPQEPTPPPA
jgi:hypothetical protein